MSVRRTASAQRSPSRRRADLHVLRYVARDTVVHRMWAGTKIVGVGVLGVTLSFHPSWGAEAVMAAFLAVTALVARIPPGAAPRPPAWLLVGVALSAVPVLLAGGRPEVHLAGLAVGLGSIGPWARLLILTVLLLLASYMLGWTTPLSDLPPALATLLSPFRRIRLPVDELAMAAALSVRCLPLLLEELRLLNAARRLRRDGSPRHLEQTLEELVDVLAGALVAAIRRAREMGEAIEARGGWLAATGSGPTPLRDTVALVVIAAAAAVMALI